MSVLFAGYLWCGLSLGMRLWTDDPFWTWSAVVGWLVAAVAALVVVLNSGA